MPEQRLIDANDLRTKAKPASDFVKQGCGELLVVGLGYVFDAPTVNAIVLPCKVGDTIYRVCGDGTIYQWDIAQINIYHDETCFIDDSDNEFEVCDIGETVFLTREAAKAAEAALADRRDEG